MDRWFWLGLGLCALGVFVCLFALVGWACHKGRQLDDPQHPYLGPP
jgi:hypothetical protein